MIVENYDGSQEQRILTAVIVSTPVLANAVSVAGRHPFAGRYTNIVYDLCVDYYRNFHKAPCTDLINIWATEHNKYEKEAANAIEDLLRFLSESHKQQETEINPEFMVKASNKYFSEVKMGRTIEQVKGYIAKGEIDKANEAFTKYVKVDSPVASGSHLFTDKDAVASVFAQQRESLIEYPGALGKFFDKVLHRDAFITFMGVEGVGKSWWLIDLAWRAMVQRRRVAFYSVGDMSEDQIKQRFLIRAAEKPAWPGSIPYPVELNKDEVIHKDKIFTKPLDEKEAWEACKKTMMEKVKSKKSYFYLETHPNSSVNVEGIRSSLKALEVQEWVPDVIVIDYADILAPEAGTSNKEYRFQTNTTWKQLRQLSQTTKTLVVTATQANRAAYKAHRLSMAHISEDKSKLAQVNLAIGIFQNDDQKDLGLYEITKLKVRDAGFSRKETIWTASCLALGNPCVLSSK